MAKVPWAPSQSKLVDSLVEVVVRHAPEGWEWAHVEVNMVAELWSGTVSVTAGDKELSGGIKEGQALALLRELRHRMYVAGAGAWYSMTLDIDPDRTATATYNYDDEPEFDPAPDAKCLSPRSAALQAQGQPRTAVAAGQDRRDSHSRGLCGGQLCAVDSGRALTCLPTT